MAKIGIIGAMELEVDTLKAKLTGKKSSSFASMDFEEGILNGAEVVIVRSGVGKVNAACCVQVLADRFNVTHVINTGVAGSLDANIDIGDIVVSTDALQHDMDVRGLGYEKGIIPQMDESDFKADPELVEKAVASCRKTCPEISVFTGRVVSGDQFISDRSVKNGIAEQFKGLCCEMEGAAIAHAAYLNKLPFVVIRAISDKADDSADMDYPTFERKAAEHSAKLVEDLAGSLRN